MGKEIKNWTSFDASQSLEDLAEQVRPCLVRCQLRKFASEQPLISKQRGTFLWPADLPIFSPFISESLQTHCGIGLRHLNGSCDLAKDASHTLAALACSGQSVTCS